MGNLCSIFHSKYKHLIKIIPCARKAHLMDYILFGWQASTYKLKNSNKKWFMKSQAEIVEDTGIALSTLQSYLKQLENDGLIERRQALYSRTNENNVFEVKKGSYISVTDKLLKLLKNDQASERNDICQQAEAPENSASETIIASLNDGQLHSSCIKINKIEGIENLNLRGSYIRDLYKSHSNNIKFKNSFGFVDKTALNKLKNQYEIIQKYVATHIKEEIPEEIKKLILGTFFNLTFEHKKQFSAPEQVVAEYLFSLINTNFCLPKVTDFKHRNDILSKIIRSNNWRTPKGFFNHFYLGKNFKEKQEIRERQWQNKKECEIKQPNCLSISPYQSVLEKVEGQIIEKGSLIEELTQSIYKQTSEEHISLIREQISKLRSELNFLYEEQLRLENQIEKEESNAIKWCA